MTSQMNDNLFKCDMDVMNQLGIEDTILKFITTLQTVHHFTVKDKR